MVNLKISKSVLDKGVSNPISGVIENVSVIESPMILMDEINTKLQYIASNKEQIVNSKYYRGFKQLFTALGYPNQQTAADRLIEQYTKKPFKSINNLVDSYNIVSALYGYPIGLHDANKIKSDIKIDLASDHETIIPMFRNSQKKVKPNDLIYKDDNGILCWMGKRDIDSDLYKVDKKTSEVFIMCMGNPITDHSENQYILEIIFKILKISCPDAKLVMSEVEIVQ
ncbi:MAG: hypothetical protein Aureis2KO_05470 [Aureisphaera sp.]